MAKNGIFMNYVSRKIVHEQNAVKDGKTRSFYNVSIPVAASANGYGSFAVNAGQVLASTKRDGTEIPGLCSILLGAPEKTRKVSIAVKKTAKSKKVTYTDVEMTNQEILDAWNESRKQYREAQKAVAVAEQ